jgi:hypothetical protein
MNPDTEEMLNVTYGLDYWKDTVFEKDLPYVSYRIRH